MNLSMIFKAFSHILTPDPDERGPKLEHLKAKLGSNIGTQGHKRRYQDLGPLTRGLRKSLGFVA